MNKKLVCIDVDWASDSIITYVADYLIDNEMKSTWFITHDSPAIKKLLARPSLFEVGIHPNFSDGSTQGEHPREIMKRLLTIAPQAKSVRTHNLLQSTPLLKMMREEFGILHDCSLLLPDTPNLVPHKFYFSTDINILRYPTFWEDDVEACSPSPSFSLKNKKYHVAGLKLFVFHPIHIILNSYTMDNYYRCKSNVDITQCSMTDLKKYVNATVNGTGAFLKGLTRAIKSGSSPQGLTVSDLAVNGGC